MLASVFFRGFMTIQLSFVFLAVLLNIGHAQVTTGTIAGTVFDPTGALVVNSTARLTNEQTGRERRSSTGASGSFRFDFLELGRYTLEIEAAGFKTERRTGIRLDQSGRVILQDLSLSVGVQADAVTVTADVPVLATSTSEQRESRSGSLTNELPVARRDLTRVVDLSAGVTQGDSTGRFIMNGLGSSSTSITQDGTDASADFGAPSTAFSGGFNVINMVSLEAIEEVQVSKGVLPAEYGRVISGNLNVVTKSGTNAFHGSGFYLLRRDALNARDPFLSLKAPLDYNQFGGSIGGPVWKNRVFFFAALEWVRSSLGATVSATVPTPYLISQIPASLPTLKKVLGFFPAPTQSVGPTDTVGVFIGPGDQSINDGNQNYKVDAWLTSTWKLTGNFNYSNPDQIIPNVVSINPRKFQGRGYRTTALLTKFASNWNSESRFGFNQPDQIRADAYFDQIDSGKEEFPGGRRYAGIRALGFQLTGELRQFGGAPQFSFDQKVSYLRGKHAFKFGGMYFRQQYSNLNLENPRFDYSNLADLLANVPNAARFTFGTPSFLATVNQYGLFLQDDWRITRTLTLNLGLRWDSFGSTYAEGEGGGAPHHFNPDGFNDAFQLGPFRPFDEPYRPSRFNLAPRFGFAQRIGQRDVIRGGYGIMYAPIVGSISRSNIVFVSPTFPFRVDLSRADAARLNTRFDGVQFNEQAIQLLSTPGGVPAYNVIDPNIKAPYAQNFSLQAQHQFGRDLVLETGYVGSRGVKFIVSQLYNEVDRITRVRPNPQVGTARYVRNGDSTMYNSWQTTLRKRFASGLNFEVYYTWGKVLSYGQGDVGSGELDNGQLQGFNMLGSNRGPAALDINHDFKWSALYRVPAFKGSAAPVRWAVGGWQVASIYKYRSGFPLSVVQANSAVGTRPDAVSGVDPVFGIRPDLLYVNRAAYAPVPLVSGVAIRPGNLGRNTLRGPEIWKFDLSFGKNFPIRERFNFEVRADLLNAFNHRTYGNPVVDLGSATFGRITSGGSPRDVQINTRFTF